jgi:pimeloyl-ACP methyl ester carboxylesterase
MLRNEAKRLSITRWLLAALAVGLILLSWQRVLAAGRGLVSRDVSAESGTPLRYVAPEGASGVPGVIVAHGFAGSSQLMTGYAYALARAGYGVVLADFDGHGRARGVLDRGGDALQRNLASAYAALAAQPEVDPARIALLGHSMGSGAVMTAAIANPERYRATVAVSPTSAAVTAEAPRNLLLMAGSLEPQFLANARSLLAAAGGPNGDLAGGRGRALVEAPNVEHITILFSRTAQRRPLTGSTRRMICRRRPSAPTGAWCGLRPTSAAGCCCWRPSPRCGPPRRRCPRPSGDGRGSGRACRWGR